MRSALELHKEVIQGLQTVDAFSQDMFLPEEFDLHLNKQQDSFLAELLDGGFADRQLRLDYVQDVIVKNKELPVFNSPTAFYYESGAINAFLPGDYKHLVSCRASVRANTDCSTITEVEEESDFYYHILKLDTNASSPPYYDKVELIQINNTQADVVLASVESPSDSSDDTYLIVRNLLAKANKTVNDVEIYWEKYSGPERQGYIEPNSFIIAASEKAIFNNPAVNSATYYRLDVTVGTVTTSTSSYLQQDVRPVQTYTTAFLNTLTDGKFVPTALLDNKELYDRNQNAFYHTKAKEPHTSLAEGILFTYYTDDFIIDKLAIDYIRDPQPISLAEDQGCELSISASHIIANRTIEFLKLAIENPAYREVLQHNEMRNQS